MWNIAWQKGSIFFFLIYRKRSGGEKGLNSFQHLLRKGGEGHSGGTSLPRLHSLAWTPQPAPWSALHTCLVTRVRTRRKLNTHTNYSWNPCYPGGGDIEVLQAHRSPSQGSLRHRSPVQWPLQNALQLAVWLGRQAQDLYLHWGFRAITLFLFRMNFTSSKTIYDFQRCLYVKSMSDQGITSSPCQSPLSWCFRYEYYVGFVEMIGVQLQAFLSHRFYPERELRKKKIPYEMVPRFHLKMYKTSEKWLVREGVRPYDGHILYKSSQRRLTGQAKKELS